MATSELSQVGKITNMLLTDSVMIEVGGSIKRIPLGDLRDAINAGGENILRQIAWGIELKQYQTSTDWSSGKVGNWLMWQEYENMCGNYVLKNNGKIAKLSPTLSSVFIDGTAATIGADSNRMYYQPEYYYLVKTESETGKTYLWQSLYPIGGQKMPAMCIGSYKGTIMSNFLRSYASQIPTTNKTITEFWNASQANGSYFGITNYDHRKAMVIKSLMKYGDTNIQAKLGYGVCGSVTASLSTQANTLLTGATYSLGDSYGATSITLTGGTNCSRVSLGGIEDPYGWQWEMCQGIYFGNSANAGQTGAEVFIYDGNRLPTASELQTQPNGKFRKLTKPTTAGYIQEIIAGTYFDIIPKTLGGGSASYWSDYFSGNINGQLVYFGNSSIEGVSSGINAIAGSQAWSGTNNIIGARLAYYGPLTFVSGKELMAS